MIRRILAAFALAAASFPASAVFHLWAIEELYSNADGSVQYLELRALAGGQQFLQGHELSSTHGGQIRVFNFPEDLPGDTSNRRMLVATEGFAALNLVTPDYVVPNGFFGSGAGQIDFAGVDVWNHPAPPTDGTLSLNRNGSTATNSPRNFLGVTGTITPAEPPRDFNFQGLWYADPPESEAGWGVGIAHQGAILFVTWFTYDTDGSQMWLVMSSANRTAANRYEGQIFRTVGPAFDTTPWDRTRVVAIPVGSGVLAFTNADRGTFTYTVNGVAQSKAIVRQEFSLPVSICGPGGVPDPDGNYQDLWWGGESESGWGINITHQGDILFAAWFTYDASGRGQYIVMSAGRRSGPGVYAGELYRTTGPAFSAVPWDPRGVTVSQVGSGTFTFTSHDSGTFRYTVNNVTQVKSITRQVFSTPLTLCR